MTSLENKIKSSIISSTIEVFATHPLDYAKTLLQNNTKNFTLQDYLKNPYKGVTSKLIGTVPMRILFWNSIIYCKEKNINPILAGIYTGSIKSILDYPIEQIKIQKMIHNQSALNAFNQTNLTKGFVLTLLRNMGFTIVLTSCIHNNDDSMIRGAIGGFMGSILTHPLDSLKTWYQAGNKNYPIQWKLNDYYKGWYFRAGISLISMNIGWIVYNKFIKYYKK